MLYNAVIFDLDGTLTDSQPGIYACARYALEKMNVPIPDDATLRRFMGPPLADSFMRFCGMNEEEATQATAFYRERYIPIGWKENRVFPRIRALLHHLKKQGIYLAVATGKPQHTSIDILKYFGLYDYFDAVAGPAPGDLHANKADLIARVLPEGKKAVMVGDHPGDIQGARDQGIASIAVLYGYGENDELIAKEPTHVCDTTDDLCALLCPDMPAPKGYFITMEGVDGCGKSTQAAALQERLTQFGYTIHRTREPGGCPLSEEIRNMLLDTKNSNMCAETEALLFAAARAQHIDQVILPAVQEGKIVLCDRFVDSSIAYQGGARGLDRAWVKEINKAALGKGAPDVTLYLRMDPETALSRRYAASTPDRIEQMGDAFQARIQAGFEQLLQEEPQRFLAVNAAQTPEQVTEDAFQALFSRMLEGGVL
ncbi:MAG: dTMP kinase [Clostridiales bacterium]|nr:dTMP kinase [Clostridiales bacterium]